VVAAGPACTKVRVGMHVGVGCLVDSCLECDKCKQGEEQKCSKSVGTYGARDKNGRARSPCGWTLGGYTSVFVVHEHFAIIIPDGYPLEAAGPVMCSGITMLDPLVKLGAEATLLRRRCSLTHQAFGHSARRPLWIPCG